MKTPWMNIRQISPQQMTVFKCSVAKVHREPIAPSSKKIEQSEPDSDQIVSTNIPDENNDTNKELEQPIGEPAELLAGTDSKDGDQAEAKHDFVENRKEINQVVLPKRLPVHEQAKIGVLTKKSPFSVHAEMADFLHEPIWGDRMQHTFEYQDLNDKKTPEVDTKLVHTTTYYPEQPDYRLVCSNIHEMIFLTNAENDGRNNRGNHYHSVAIPVHDPLLMNTGQSSHDSFMQIRVPVVLGEYKIEICLEENIVFKEQVMGLKEISKEIVLTHFRFIPTAFSPPLRNGTRSVLKGNLLIEGYIQQAIEYITLDSRDTDSITPLNQLCQKMVVELIIHILQVQQMGVSYDGKNTRR